MNGILAILIAFSVLGVVFLLLAVAYLWVGFSDMEIRLKNMGLYEEGPMRRRRLK